jgi:hypothetical protein
MIVRLIILLSIIGSSIYGIYSASINIMDFIHEAGETVTMRVVKVESGIATLEDNSGLIKAKTKVKPGQLKVGDLVEGHSEGGRIYIEEAIEEGGENGPRPTATR